MSTDYKLLGLKAGLEIHQQLDTSKLFCNCPSVLRDDAPDAIVKRRLTAVAGETGEVDIAALHETSRKAAFNYEIYHNTTCLVELDDEPPHPVNPEALRIAMEVALLLNAKPVQEIQVMRKTVVDGSNTSGFQRTALVARNGHIQMRSGKVRIATVCLEEDSAKIISQDRQHGMVTYRLDRLGIPLIEIATEPDIHTPEQAKEVAEYLGMVLRSTGKVKRGLGTIRQDVNISIEKGARVEIKGVQDLRSIPKVIEKEAERQLSLLKQNQKPKSEVRKANPDNTTSFLRPMPGAARMYPETDVPPVPVTKEYLMRIKLPKLLTDKLSELAAEYGLSEALAKEIIARNVSLEEYKALFPNIAPAYVAQILIEVPKDIKARLKADTGKLVHEDFLKVFRHLNDGEITKEAVPEILVELAKGHKLDISKYKSVPDEELKKEIDRLKKEKPDLSSQAYMGLIMSKFRGKVSGKKVMEMLQG
ncbi:Glu-tRNA(Gln) amidotransferase subunit GatE [Candidatus Woesearchaeota archaeon]|nr:Glu-tRNA(Gln) amidotransferase subunit GatE [Candidatus Woesearchaeota archaeon]